MSDLLAKYGTSNQGITVTLAGLTNNSLRQSAAIDNSSNKWLDVLVMLKIKSGAASTSSSGLINVYAAGSADGGTSYTDGASGSDAAMTPTSPTNLRLIGVINVVANATTYTGGPFSVAAAFGGVLPDHFSLIIENKTGGTLDATEGNHAKFYQGVAGQSV